MRWPHESECVPAFETQQPDRVEQDQQRADLVDDRGGDRPQNAKAGQRATAIAFNPKAKKRIFWRMI